MKSVATASAVILGLTLGADAYAKKSSVSGGTTVDTTYDFSKDNFGSNDVLNLGTTVTQAAAPAAKAGGTAKAGGSTAPKPSTKKGGKRGLYARDSENWGIYIRDADGEYIYERAAYPKKSSTVSGGNQVSNSYAITGDTFGSNSNFNMQSTTAINGGNTAAAISNGGKKGKGKRGLYESSYLEIRDIDDLLYERDAEADAEADAEIEAILYEREAFMNGGAAKGGSTSAKGGNNSSNNNKINKTNLSGNHQIINMSSATSQKGGNVQGGNGGANGGNGGGGGSLGMSVALPPIPRKRWLAARDLEIQEREAELEALIVEREAFMNGGGASGGNSKSQGGNNSKNNNKISGTNLKGNGQIINMSSSTAQKGGNVKGGNGGVNMGNGGAGGGMQLSAQLPPIPMKRWISERDAYPEELYFEERDAEPEYEEWMSLYAREAYPEAEAEAEADAEADYDFEAGLYAREAYGYDDYDY
ncbi:hypothetical protein MMC18_004909 [Xylographa bjoerkii]|nr:hypothetical protein [Xylographa bjoerkii]